MGKIVTYGMQWFSRPLGAGVGIIVVGGIIYSLFFTGSSGEDEMLMVTKGSIVQEVAVTGKMQPVNDVELSFEKSGKVSRVNVQVGDMVGVGVLLVELDSTDLAADLREAEAAVDAARAQLLQYRAAADSQRAKLNELKRGSRPEEIRIQEIKLSNAKTAFEDAKQNLFDKIKDAYTKSDDAIRNKADDLFSNPGTNPQLSIAVDAQTKSDIEQRRYVVEGILDTWQTALASLTASGDLISAGSSAEKNLRSIATFLDRMAYAVNSLKPSSSYSQTTIDTWKGNISTARTNVNTATTNLSAAKEKFRSADSDVILQENELLLERAGASAEEIAAKEADLRQAEANSISQEANIKKAEAAASSIRAQRAKSVLRAPIAGTVTKQDAKVGENTSANTHIISIISAEDLEIEAQIPEVDVAKIAKGNHVRITLDALPGEEFSGDISYVDPAETVIDGVVNFKVRVAILRSDARFKPGLTANLEIETLRKDGVLILPQYAIVEKNAATFVRVPSDGAVIERAIVTGIRSQDGSVEVLSGVVAGEKVLNIGSKER